MFTFDVTLIIQAVHFMIAWWFIDRFLFKALVIEVLQEQSFLGGLQNKLAGEQQLVAATKHQKEQEWENFRNRSKQHIPQETLPLELFKDEVVCAAPSELSPEEKTALVATITDKLIRRVTHD